MNLLMFTKSDEEEEVRGTALANKVKETLKKNFVVVETDESEDEAATVRLISKKLRKKRQNLDTSSSEDEAEQTQRGKNSAFDQFKAKRTQSKEKSIKENTVTNESSKYDSEHEDVIEIEKKLKRKIRQPDAISSDEQEQLDDLFERLRKQTEKSISAAAKTKKKFVSKDFALNVEEKSALLNMQETDFVEENGLQDHIIKMTNKTAYAASLIDSDGAADTKNDADDTTSNQSVNNVEVNNKRQRSPSASVNAASDSDLSNENNDENVNGNDEIASSMRRSYGKRRRLAVIDDDEDEDD